MAIRQRNDPVRLLGRRLLIAGLLLLVAAAAWGTWGAYHKEQESVELRTQAQAQLSDLTSQQEKLNSDISKLETARGKEEILRDQYALAGKGEGLIVIIDPTSTEIHATSTAFAAWLHNAFPWW